MSTLDGASLSSAGALAPPSMTPGQNQPARHTPGTTRGGSPEDAASVALGYEYARLAIGESNRQVEQAEQLQKEREERYAAEKREERQEALKKASREQLKGQDSGMSGGASDTASDDASSLITQSAEGARLSGTSAVIGGDTEGSQAAANPAPQQDRPQQSSHIDLIA